MMEYVQESKDKNWPPHLAFGYGCCCITSTTAIEKQTKALNILKSSLAVQPVFQIFMLCSTAEYFISSKQPATHKELLPHIVLLFSLSILKFHFSLWISQNFIAIIGWHHKTWTTVLLVASAKPFRVLSYFVLNSEWPDSEFCLSIWMVAVLNSSLVISKSQWQKRFVNHWASFFGYKYFKIRQYVFCYKRNT